MSSTIQFSVLRNGDDTFVTAYVPGRGLLPPIGNDHPNFDAILQAAHDVLDGEVVDVDQASDLFDVAATVERKLNDQALSANVKVENGQIVFNGKVIDNALTQQVLAFLNEGVADWQPLVQFFEKVERNTNDHSREQLFEWLRRREFAITSTGDIVFYKGVNRDSQGDLRSTRSGPGIVNGESFADAYLRNNPGDLVEMERSSVAWDPSQGCSTGLHVANWDYASNWASVTVEVHVDPADVVSVPTDCDWQKVRCCRYRVIGEVTAPYKGALVVTEADAPEADEDPKDLAFDTEDDGPARVGDRVADEDGDEGVLTDVSDPSNVGIVYDAQEYNDEDDSTQADPDGFCQSLDSLKVVSRHGKGGQTSQAAKGRGRNPAQDTNGRFVNGRPGSARDASTGRFA